jgi:signal transduction histidine kinase
VLGFVAIYVPVLLLLGVTVATEDEETSTTLTGVEVATEASSNTSPWVTWTVILLGPVAAGVAWWWAGRAVRPIERIRAVAEDIEGSDLSRRIGLDHGASEIVSLAASFDAMFERLERAADTQRQLIEETSHELRTPLSVLVTNADVMLAHPQPTVELYRQGLERSRVAAERLRTTIGELLVDARGRARAIDRQPADLVTLVRDVVEEARPLAATRSITVNVTGPTTVVCRLDVPTVRRAFANLVDNAIRHSPNGSSVGVGVSADPNEVTVTVTDHGRGIALADQDHIFERFWRGTRDAHGTGLGLPIAKQVALAHGGTVSVTSPGPTGEGSVFRLTLRR